MLIAGGFSMFKCGLWCEHCVAHSSLNFNLIWSIYEQLSTQHITTISNEFNENTIIKEYQSNCEKQVETQATASAPVLVLRIINIIWTRNQSTSHVAKLNAALAAQLHSDGNCSRKTFPTWSKCFNRNKKLVVFVIHRHIIKSHFDNNVSLRCV